MKIGDGPKLPPLPGKTDGSATKAAAFPDVAKTPTPGGPVPMPYPNVGGDSFERVASPPLGGLLGAVSAKQPPAPAALAKEVGGFLAAGDGAGAMQAWIGGVAASGGGNVMETLMLVMKESIAATNEDKKYYLEKMQGFNQQAEALSDYLTGLASASAELAAKEKAPGGDAGGFAEQVRGFHDAKESLLRSLGGLGEDDVKSLIERFEEKLSSIGDDAQLANVDLQNVLQKQQQTMQMMSNVSKLLYDTAQGVIRKLGG